jgi:hypothetical protein
MRDAGDAGFPFRATTFLCSRQAGQPSAIRVRLVIWGKEMGSPGVRRVRYKRPVCPYCQFDDQVVRIVYGLPQPETIERSRRQEVALGGDYSAPDAPEWYCRGCLQCFNAPDFVDGAEAGS